MAKESRSLIFLGNHGTALTKGNLRQCASPKHHTPILDVRETTDEIDVLGNFAQRHLEDLQLVGREGAQLNDKVMLPLKIARRPAFNVLQGDALLLEDGQGPL